MKEQGIKERSLEQTITCYCTTVINGGKIKIKMKTQFCVKKVMVMLTCYLVCPEYLLVVLGHDEGKC